MTPYIEAAKNSIRMNTIYLKGQEVAGKNAAVVSLGQVPLEILDDIQSNVIQDREYHRDFSKLMMHQVIFGLDCLAKEGESAAVICDYSKELVEAAQQWIMQDDINLKEKAIENIERVKVMVEEAFPERGAETIRIIGEVEWSMKRSIQSLAEVKDDYMDYAKSIVNLLNNSDSSGE